MKCFKFLLLLFLCGCTSIYYQPSKEIYFKVNKDKLLKNDVWLQTADNLRLNGWYFPAQKNKKTVPAKAVVILFHGNAQNISSHYLNLFWLTNYPVDYMLFDYRSYGQSEGDLDNTSMLVDVAAMYDYARKEADKKKVPLILYGQSMGGTLLLKYLSLHPELKYDDLVIESAFYSFSEIGEMKFEQVWFLWPFQWLPYILVSNKNSLTKEELRLLKQPKLFIHSRLDPVVPYEQGEKIYKLAAEPKEIITTEWNTHINNTNMNQGELRQCLIERWHF